MLKLIKNILYNPTTRKFKGFIAAYEPVSNYFKNKKFNETLSALRESDKYSKQQIRDLQLNNLKRLVNHAYQNVPYYKRVFDASGINPNDINSFEDFSKIPVLTKDIVRENFADLIATNFKKTQIKHSSTSGSTGHPFTFMVEKKYSTIIEKAFIYNIWNRIGYNRKSRLAVLTGATLPKADKGILWKYERISHQLILSSFHIFENTYQQYVDKMNEKKIEYIKAYPSAISLLAKYMGKTAAKPIPTLKGIFCASETLHDWQRKLLEDTFKCKIFSHYGHTEKCVLAGECEVNPKYHIQPEYGFVELLDENGKIINDEKVMGEIVATSFTNYVMPLIRYRTMDMASYNFEECSCGRNFVIFNKVEGRALDYFVDKEGKLIGTTGSVHIIKQTPNILKYQFQQNVKGEVNLRIMPTQNFDDKDIKNINKFLKDVYHNNLKFNIELVEDILPLSNGKYKFIIQDISIDYENYANIN